MVRAAIRVGKIVKRPNFVEVVFQVLNHSWRAVLDEVVHGVERFVNAAPLRLFGLHFGPQMFHDDIVVLPVVGVVGQHLQLGVRDVPVFVACAFLKNLLVLLRGEHRLLFAAGLGGLTCYWRRCRENLSCSDLIIY